MKSKLFLLLTFLGISLSFCQSRTSNTQNQKPPSQPKIKKPAPITKPRVLHTPTKKNTSTPKQDPDAFVLELTKDVYKTRYSIHGLWPERKNINGKLDGIFNCSKNNKIDENSLEKLLRPFKKRLEQEWPSNPNMTNLQFWKYQWDKHGSCSDLTVEKFFEKTLELFALYHHICTAQSPKAKCQLLFNQSLQFNRKLKEK